MPKTVVTDLKHPKGLWWVSISYALYVFGFFTLTSLMVLYMRDVVDLSHAYTYAMMGSFLAMMYGLPIISGHAVGRIGYQRVANYSSILTIVGVIILILNIKALFLWGLVLVSAAYGFSAPAYYCLPGLLYSRNDVKRESGVTTFYTVFNMGAFVAIFSGGWLARYFGYQLTFTIAAIMMLLACFILLWGHRYIRYVDTTTAQRVFKSPAKRIGLFLLVIVVMGAASDWVFAHPLLMNQVMSILATILLIVMVYALRKLSVEQRRKAILFMMLCVIAFMFFVVYAMEPSVVTVFIRHNVDRVVGDATIPAASFFSLDTVFVVLFGFILRWLWSFLKTRGQMPNKLASFGLGLCMMGLGMFMLVVGILFHNPHTLMTHFPWVIAAYACLGLAELLIVPIGFSMVGELAPPHFEGLFMGIFSFCIAYAAIVAGFVGMESVGGHAGLVVTNHLYAHNFKIIGFIGFGIALLTFLLIPVSKKFHLLKARDI